MLTSRNLIETETFYEQLYVSRESFESIPFQEKLNIYMYDVSKSTIEEFTAL